MSNKSDTGTSGNKKSQKGKKRDSSQSNCPDPQNNLKSLENLSPILEESIPKNSLNLENFPSKSPTDYGKPEADPELISGLIKAVDTFKKDIRSLSWTFMQTSMTKVLEAQEEELSKRFLEFDGILKSFIPSLMLKEEWKEDNLGERVNKFFNENPRITELGNDKMSSKPVGILKYANGKSYHDMYHDPQFMCIEGTDRHVGEPLTVAD
ncbi:hypothetical protein GYMLUDRAFT_236324 [Collybiopsis luxurians FD-317 M1]|nr:hypothetical protein GYMLUDRAFT_236324 [Collybiopsis luxurians FD-317 M1]